MEKLPKCAVHLEDGHYMFKNGWVPAKADEVRYLEETIETWCPKCGHKISEVKTSIHQ